MIVLKLSKTEIEAIFANDAGEGGWQSLMQRLKDKTDGPSMTIQLDDRDLEQIRRYAFDYGNGGWENRLRTAFERNLGPTLSRLPKN